VEELPAEETAISMIIQAQAGITNIKIQQVSPIVCLIIDLCLAL
jgi:hypothetical protein